MDIGPGERWHSGQSRQRKRSCSRTSGFTALTEAHGDEQAADLVGGFCVAVRQLLAAHQAQEVKTIGDALMLRTGDAAASIRLGLCIVHDVGAQHGFPLVRVGMHTGSAVERDGDWFGTTVNLAARVSAAASGGEALLTAATKAASGDLEGVELRERGRRAFRNVGEPVQVFVAVRQGAHNPSGLPIDPVCRMAVHPWHGAGRLTHEGVEYCFCSLRCAGAFAQHPSRYTANDRQQRMACDAGSRLALPTWQRRADGASGLPCRDPLPEWLNHQPTVGRRCWVGRAAGSGAAGEVHRTRDDPRQALRRQARPTPQRPESGSTGAGLPELPEQASSWPGCPRGRCRPERQRHDQSKSQRRPESRCAAPPRPASARRRAGRSLAGGGRDRRGGCGDAGGLPAGAASWPSPGLAAGNASPGGSAGCRGGAGSQRVGHHRCARALRGLRPLTNLLRPHSLRQPPDAMLSGGLAVVPDYSLEDVDAGLAPEPDVIVVPAVAAPNGKKEAPLREWITRRVDRGAHLLGVCNGSRLLAATGLLDGRRATSHWSSIGGLQRSRPQVDWVRGQRYIQDGTLTTTAGVTSGVFGALRLVEQLAGAAEAQRVGQELAYPGWTLHGPTEIRTQRWAPHDLAYLLAVVFPWLRPTVGDGLCLVATPANAGALQIDRLIVPGVGPIEEVDSQLLGWAADRGLNVELPNGGQAAGEFSFDAMLGDLASHSDQTTARVTAKSIEYPTEQLELAGAAWPWRPTALFALTATAATGVALLSAAATRRNRR